MDDTVSGGRKSQDEQELARRLRGAREFVGLSQDAVAQHLGVPRASVSAFEAGKRKVSGLELRTLARLYRTTVGTLLGEDASEDPLVQALFRTTQSLTDHDRQQVLRFAEFLRSGGPAPESAT